MYFSQNKLGDSGGPQYWLNELSTRDKDHLRRRKVCEVVLMTRYGEVPTKFEAVHKDYSRDKKTGKLVKAHADHDRLQKGSAPHSIWREICRWFGFPKDAPIERVDADITQDGEGRFVLIPYKFTFRGQKRIIEFPKPHLPLSVGANGPSNLLKEQIKSIQQKDAVLFVWIRDQITRVIHDHRKFRGGIHEADLLRAAGALYRLGVRLGPYHTRGLDCRESEFRFLDLPEYPCRVEVKHRSSDIDYQVKRYGPLGRLVVLCLDDNLTNPPDEKVDVIALSALEHLLKSSS